MASTQKRIDTTKKKISKSGTKTESKRTTSQEKQAPKAQAAKPNAKKQVASPEPQFRYITPIEEAQDVKDVAQRSLDASVTITTRELLSISPDVRRHIKDLVSTKCVAMTAFTEEMPNEEMGSYLAGLIPRTDSLIVAKDIEELRALDVNIEGTTIEALADDRSQVVSIRGDLWERLGIPIRSDRTIVMESANKSKNETMGLLQDLKFGYNFYVQVQVVQDAPYELLLGRPFFTLTQATH